MCGIIGVFPVTPEAGATEIPKSVRELAIRFLTSHMLLESKSRGLDATGLSIHMSNSEWAVLKQPVDAEDFLLNVPALKVYPGQEENANFQNLLRGWRAATSVDGVQTACALGHVRKSTRGNTENHKNNHPIVVENTIVGVHNGTLRNDDEIFEKVTHRKRAGVVDSEAIFHLHHALAPDAPPTIELMWEIACKLRGAYTTMHVNTKFPRIIGGLRKDRPLEVGYLHGLDLVVACSNDTFLKDSVRKYNIFAGAAGAEIPPVTKITTKMITDGPTGRILIYDLDKPFTTLDEWLTVADGPKPLEEDKAYDVHYAASSTTTGTTVHTHAFQPKTPAEKTAVSAENIIDLTVYTSAEGDDSPVEEDSGEDPSDESTVVTVEAADEEEDGLEERVTVSASTVFGKPQVDLDGEELDIPALFSEGEDVLQELKEWEGRLMLDGLGDNGEGIESLFPKVEDSLDELMETSVDKDPGVFWQGVKKLLGTCAAAVYESAFPEGYVAGYGSAMDDVLQKLESGDHNLGDFDDAKADRLQERLKKATKHIANLKTVVTALLIVNKQVEVNDNRLHLNKYVVEYAEYLNTQFNAEAVEGLLSQGTTPTDVGYLLDAEARADEKKVEEEIEKESTDEAQPNAAKVTTF